MLITAARRTTFSRTFYMYGSSGNYVKKRTLSLEGEGGGGGG